ncbi:cyclic nucleotide-gated ion channel 18 [Tanacetum coccineum]
MAEIQGSSILITLRTGRLLWRRITHMGVTTYATSYPCSTRSVRTLTEVEGFALKAEDLKFVANQFKYLHSKKLQHIFRYYSHQWRTWGACFIQAAWQKFKRRKLVKELLLQENAYYNQDGELVYESGSGDSSPSSDGPGGGQQVRVGATILASNFVANTRRGSGHHKVASIDSTSLKMPQLFKLDEPHF